MTRDPQGDATPPTLQEIIEWDVPTWSRILPYWKEVLGNAVLPARAKALEVGARRGGLSLFLAWNYPLEVHCTDLNMPDPEARGLHARFGVEEQLTYAVADVNALPYDDNTFDVVVFKSVIGAVGADGRIDRQQQAFREIHRVLKDGGHLLFAENLSGAWLHRVARKRLVSWYSYWRYLSCDELRQMLSEFSEVRLRTTGCCAVFFPGRLRNFGGAVDGLVERLLPASWHYMAYGYARK